MTFSITNNSFSFSQNICNDDSFSTPEQPHGTQAPALAHADDSLIPSDNVEKNEAAKNNFSQQIALEDKKKTQQLNARLVPESLTESTAKHVNEKKSQQDNLPPGLWLSTMSMKTEDARPFINGMSQEQLGTQNHRGDTTLFLAIMLATTDITNLIINRMTPAQLGIQNKKKNTALIFAIPYPATDIAKTLINKMKSEHLGLQDENGNTALIAAINIEILKNTLTDITDLELAFFNTQNVDEAKKLILAEKEERIDMIKLLIQKMKKEQLDIKNENGETALILAKKAGLTDIVKILNSNINDEKPHPKFSRIRGLLSFLASAINWLLNPAAWVRWMKLR